MGTTPFPVKEEPTAAVRVESGLREVIAGHPQGAVRRIVLYVVLAVGATLGIMLLEATLWPLAVLALIVALVAYVLLVATDQLA